MLVSPLFLVWGIREILPARERQTQAVTASAVITHVNPNWVRRRGAQYIASYSYKYEFSVDGHAYSGFFADYTDDPTHHLNEIVPIAYLRSNPADNNYGGTLNDARWHSPSGFIVLALLTFVIGLAFYKGWPSD